jgi:hypothetical protein
MDSREGEERVLKWKRSCSRCLRRISLKPYPSSPEKDYESLLREIEKLARTDRKVTANFIEAQELNMLSGLISIGGDSLEDTERVYD